MLRTCFNHAYPSFTSPLISTFSHVHYHVPFLKSTNDAIETVILLVCMLYTYMHAQLRMQKLNIYSCTLANNYVCTKTKVTFISLIFPFVGAFTAFSFLRMLLTTATTFSSRVQMLPFWLHSAGLSFNQNFLMDFFITWNGNFWPKQRWIRKAFTSPD